MKPYQDDLEAIFSDILTSQMEWRDAHGTLHTADTILRQPQEFYGVGQLEVQEARTLALLPMAHVHHLVRYTAVTVDHVAYTVLGIQHNQPHHGIARIFLTDEATSTVDDFGQEVTQWS